MKATSSLLAASSLITVFGATAARAEEIALNFDLPPLIMAEEVEDSSAITTATAPVLGAKPLPIPAGASNPPMRSHKSHQLPGGVYRQAVAAGLSAGNSPAALLPPAPPLEHPVPITATKPEEQPTPFIAETESEATDSETVALSFDVAPLVRTQISQARPAPAAKLPANPLESLFEGGTDSLVARAVGSAEGTRTPSGGITAAYYGHSDPGNGVWNMGTFSYQHGAKNAAEADQKQLNRLLSQGQVLKHRAEKYGLNLTLEETLNGIDLANQSPLAAIGRVGYVERLVEARNMGYDGSEAIVMARTRSYINPDTQRWNAPGLGNTLASITRDQRRRANAVAQSIAVYQQENVTIDWQSWALMPPPESSPASDVAPAPTEAPEEPADIAFSLWTDGHEPSEEDENPLAVTRLGPEYRESSASRGSLLARTPAVVTLAHSKPTSTKTSTSEVAGSGEVAQSSANPIPTWAEAREGNQSMVFTPDQKLNHEKGGARSSAHAPDTETLHTTPDSGAVPDTKVMPPLMEELQPIQVSSFTKRNQKSSSSGELSQALPSSAQPLPEGLLAKLHSQLELRDDGNVVSPASLRDQITDSMLEIDLPALPGLE